jgi:hypothetical protein
MMRGIGYAIGEIAVFMLAATLVGYLMGRFAPVRSAAVEVLDPSDDASAELEAMLLHASSLEAAVDDLGERVVELETENAALRESGGPVHDPPAGPDGEADDAEVSELIAEVERQREIIAQLEHVAAASAGMEEAWESREARLAALEAAVARGDHDPAAMPVSFSGASWGSGRFADATIDFDAAD